jgi:hypothetical protein
MTASLFHLDDLRFAAKHENAADDDAEQTKCNRTARRDDENVEAGGDVDVLIAVVADPTLETGAVGRHVGRIAAHYTHTHTHTYETIDL